MTLIRRRPVELWDEMDTYVAGHSAGWHAHIVLHISAADAALLMEAPSWHHTTAGTGLDHLLLNFRESACLPSNALIEAQKCASELGLTSRPTSRKL